MVKQTSPASLVCDLKIGEPDRTGIDVLAEVGRIFPKVHLKLFTSYALSADEEARLNHLGAELYRKSDGVEELFRDLHDLQSGAQFSLPESSGENAELLRMREVAELLATDFVAQLRQVKDPTKLFIVSEGTRFSIAELIADVEGLTDRGIEYIRLWTESRALLRRMGRDP